MWTRHCIARFEVGQGAGDAHDAVIAAGGKFERVDGLGEERQARRVGARDRFQKFAVGFDVGADRLAGETAALNVARGADAGGDFG